MVEQIDPKERLIDLRNGSKSAFTSFYEHYRPLLYASIYKWVKSHEVSQEIFHDVFVIVWNRREQIDLDKSFKAYLYKIAQNQVLDYFRKLASDRKKRELFKLNYAIHVDMSTEQTIAYNDTRSYLNEILTKIPEKCRAVYVLCKIEGRSHDEVAKLLNISVATVNNHMVKASKIIKSNWKSGVYSFTVFILLFS